MPLFRLRDVSLSFGSQVLFDKLELDVHAGQHFGLLGRNGTGKSTLLKLFDEQVLPDDGEVWRRSGIKVAFLAQELPEAEEVSVFDFVSGGLAEVGELLKRFHHLSLSAGDEASLNKLAEVQHQIDVCDGWSFQQKVDSVISDLQLSADALMSELSGGWRRRVAFGRVLVCDPDVLLLDEPTNHLDIPTILWLEKLLKGFQGALVVITHDRAFLQNVVDHILELDRGHLRSWKGSYQGFLKFRDQELAAEESANALFDKKLAKEEVWIRQGIKARRTRNEGRVRALKALRDERSQRREVVGKAKFGIEHSGLSGKVVVEIEDVCQRFGDNVVIDHFSTKIMRGDRVGFVGPNGAGKSTLLKILLGELVPSSGSVQLGTKIEVAYFDQLREHLDLDKSVIDNLSEGREFISIDGKDRHVISYLRDFLFEPDGLRQPVSRLSGGEQNRLILAKLFSKPANVLVLDEPTNDLDLETLDLLEDLLVSFKGTILLVSHDRAFLDNVVSSCIVFEGEGKVVEYVGGFQDRFLDSWGVGGVVEKSVALVVDVEPVEKSSSERQLSFEERKELGKLPGLIEKAEKQKAELAGKMAEVGFYEQDRAVVDEVLKAFGDVEKRLEGFYARWEALEG